VSEVSPDVGVRRTSSSEWLAGARPKTLPAAIVPVLVGTGVAAHDNNFVWWRALLALVVSLALQVGVNYANDYSDGIRGTDEKRTGPVRLVGQGLVSPHSVKRAAFISFGVAMIAGLALCLVSSLWLLLLGAVSIVAAWFYTGGKKPYGYRGLGELSVFVFFGLAAVMGTAYVQQRAVTGLSFVAAIPVGLLAVALLVVNNLRDIENDARSGKRTLAVRIGDRRTRALYAACAFVPFIVSLLIAWPSPWALISWLALPFAIAAVRPVVRGDKGRALIAVLQRTGRLQLVFGVLLTIGLAI
jgi:1,4-dihydroxy-2-naphthoate polyprenyltransferase